MLRVVLVASVLVVPSARGQGPAPLVGSDPLVRLAARADAACTAALPSVPHRLVAFITERAAGGELRSYRLDRTWLSPDAWRDECHGPDGHHVQARSGQTAWKTACVNCGSRLDGAFRALTPAGPVPPEQLRAARDRAGAECLVVRVSRRPEVDPLEFVDRSLCLRGNRIVSVEEDRERWEFDGHAPFGSSLVPRRLRCLVDGTEACVIEIATLEPFAGSPETVVSRRPAGAIDDEPPCGNFLPPRAIYVDNDWAKLRAAGSNGRAHFCVLIGADGSMSVAQVLGSDAGARATRLAREALMRTRAEPARCDGLAVPWLERFIIDFGAESR